MSKTIKCALSVLLCAAMLFGIAQTGVGAGLSSFLFKAAGADALLTSILSAGPEGNVLVSTKANTPLCITTKSDVSELKLVKQGGATETWVVGSNSVTAPDNGDGTKTWTKKYAFSEGRHYYTVYAKVNGEYEANGVDFTVNATTSTVTISVSLTGLGTVYCYYNGGTKKTVTGSKQKITVAKGDVVTLVAKPKTINGFPYEFLFWNNKTSNNLGRRFNSDKTYKLQAAFDMEFDAQFSPNCIDINHENKYIVYVNQAGNIVKNLELYQDQANGTYTLDLEGNDAFDDADVPAGPHLQDYTFKGWSMTPAEVMASEEQTFLITPVYALTETYTVTIPEGDYETYGAGEYTCTDDERALVNIGASAQNGAGQVFQYWLDCDTNEIVTYSRGYLFYALKNTTLCPIYGDEPVEAKPVVRVAAVKAGRARANFYVERSVPGAYEVIQSGAIATKTELIGTDSNLFVIGANGTGMGTSISRSADGFYTAVVNVDFGETVWARGYLIYRDAAGDLHTIYSPIVSYTR